MTTWYKAGFGKIEEVEVERETELFVVFKNGRRSAKNSDWVWYAQDREQAKQVMIANYQRQLDLAKHDVIVNEKRLEEARSA
jgi:hypothetical protein